MVMQMGNPQGYVRPGTPGSTNSFPYLDISTAAMRRLAHTRRALLSNKTLDYAPSDNDNLFNHRSVYDSEFPKNPVLFGALNANQLLGRVADIGTQGAQGTAFVDSKGVTWTFSANANNVGGVFVPTANGQVVVNSVAADNMAALALQHSDPGNTALNWIAINYNTTAEMLRVFRQSATNVRVERVVASTPATEADITVVAATDPVGTSALGIRRNGTTCTVFLNGRKIASFTLNAASQAFTGTGVAFQTTTAGRQNNDLMEIYSKLT